MAALDALRAYLLPKTLAHAVEGSAFYAAHLGDAWRDVHDLADLPKLPLLTKTIAAREQERMRIGVASFDVGAVSSGSVSRGAQTAGADGAPPLFAVEHCPEEREALAAYLETVGDARRAEGLSAGDAVVLNLHSPNHGTSRAYTPRGTSIVWAPYSNVCALVERTLLREVDGARVTHLVASNGILKELTAWLLDRGADFSRFGLRGVTSHASLLTRRWQRTLEAAWGVPVNELYAVSEIDTPAFACGACGFHHFGAPPVIAEVIDPVTLAPVDLRTPVEGRVGELVLTALYPYSQRQPMIRYATGDIVEVGLPCRARDELGVRFVGRATQIILDRAGGVGTGAMDAPAMLLAPTELEHVADERPEVARHPTIFETVNGWQPGRVGQPKVRAERVAGGDDEIVVEIGVVFDPRLFADRAATFAREVAAALVDKHPALAQRRLSVRPVYGDGARGSWFRKAGS
jgi:phenylacetate-coenzyme A ligase PaaK-like adenylate-forming protein